MPFSLPAEGSAMRTALVVGLAAFGLALVPPAARADLAPPVPPAKDVKFTVEVDENAKGPKLIVPQHMTTVRVRPLRPGAAPKAVPPGKGEPVALEIESDDVAVEPAPENRNHLMIAGVALTLSLGLGGVWLVRRHGRGTTRGLALLLAAGGTLAVSTIVWANAAPPPPRPPQKEKVVLPVAFNGQVNLEVVVGGDTIRLVLDKATYEAMKKDPKKPEGSK
jgi:hypothetical protein